MTHHGANYLGEREKGTPAHSLQARSQTKPEINR